MRTSATQPLLVPTAKHAIRQQDSYPQATYTYNYRSQEKAEALGPSELKTLHT